MRPPALNPRHGTNAHRCAQINGRAYELQEIYGVEHCAAHRNDIGVSSSSASDKSSGDGPGGGVGAGAGSAGARGIGSGDSGDDGGSEVSAPAAVVAVIAANHNPWEYRKAFANGWSSV